MSKSIGNVVDPDVVINGGEVSQALEFLRIASYNLSLPNSATDLWRVFSKQLSCSRTL